MKPTPASLRRKTERNREILARRHEGETYVALARTYRLSLARIKTIITLEEARVEREAELALADAMPVQPNPLHLTLETRRMVADAVRKDDFTREDVLAVGIGTVYREPGFSGTHGRELRAWLDRPTNLPPE
jgi:hypothetical protein